MSSNGKFDVKAYVRAIIGPMLDFPEDCRVEVSKSEGGSVTTIEIFPFGSDYGKVVGKKGRNFDALDVILKAVEWNNKDQRTRYVLRVDTVQASSRD